MFLIFSYQTLDAIDGKHARNTKNSSPLGELFDHACDNVSVVFIVNMIATVCGVESLENQWYLIQIVQLVFLNTHIDALQYKAVEFSLLTGPGEALVLCEGILLFRAFGFTIPIPGHLNQILTVIYTLPKLY